MTSSEPTVPERPELILIAAMTADRVIGSANALPWDIPEEYARFLGYVRGNVVLMGRISYEIFGADLAESEVIVVSSSVKDLPGADVCPDIEAALGLARSRRKRIFSAGGASIYRLTLPLADAMYLSIVKGTYEGDRRFPKWNEEDWAIARREDHPRFEFRVYERRRPEAGARIPASEETFSGCHA